MKPLSSGPLQRADSSCVPSHLAAGKSATTAYLGRAATMARR